MSSAKFESPLDSPVLTALIEVSGDAIWAVDPERRLLAFNQRFVSLCRRLFQRVPTVGMDLEELMKDSSPLDTWSALHMRVLAGRSLTADEWLPLDGTRRYFMISGAPFTSRNGEIDGGVFTARDLTESRSREQGDAIELTLSRIFSSDLPKREVFRGALEFICVSERWDGAILWMVDDEGIALVPSAMWFEPGAGLESLQARVDTIRFSYGHGLPGRTWRDADVAWVPDLLDETGLHRGQFLLDAGMRSVVAAPLTDSGRILGVMELFSRIPRQRSEDRKRSILHTAIALAHLIERRSHEEERRDLNARIERKGFEWALTFDALDQPVLLAAPDGTILRVNRAARDLTERDYAELIGRTIPSIGPTEPWKTLHDLVTSTRETDQGGTARIDTDDVVWDVSSTFCRGLDGDDRIIVMMRDITNIIRLQEAVRRGEHFAALGELVAGVAHEVKNPIFGMSATIDAMESFMERNKDVDELIGALRRWLGRLNQLMESLLEYGTPWTTNLQPGAVEGVIAQAIESCLPRAESEELTIESDVEPGLTILMDPNRLVHVFENLITNAIQHSPKGSVVIVTGRTAADRKQIECTVRDHGPGFMPGDLTRIFQAFFTRRRGGTGLGLSIVQRITEEHGGRIAAENDPARGAVVRITFPYYPAPGASV
jgi:signal transduction histidine kinase